MAKKIKMVLYGEPGVGKSTFAVHAPKPFFICTDGNYEWLDGADPNAYCEINKWSDAKKLFNSGFEGYDTIVVDLLEDLFKYNEYEYCSRNKIEHLSDLGYGKGYDATRNEFFIEITKLLGLDKNVILIMHGMDKVVKDRRGVEKTIHVPSTRIPDKVIDMIEGRVRYFVRCYLKDEELDDGTLLKKRYLSIIPKPNEFGISRGLDENAVPHDIPLDFAEFAKVIGYEYTNTNSEVKSETILDTIKSDSDISKTKIESVEKVEEAPKRIRRKRAEKNENPTQEKMVIETPVETKTEEVDFPSKDESPFEMNDDAIEPVEEVKTAEEVKNESVKQEIPKVDSREDKLAAIRAKLAAMKNR